jgi:hypothetical protein
LTESKLQLSLFKDNVLDFTNSAHAPLWHLIKANKQPSFQHFWHAYHGSMDAHDEEFHTFVVNFYAEYCVPEVQQRALQFWINLTTNTTELIISGNGPKSKTFKSWP